MADYAALKTLWAGLTGTTDEKVAAVNATTVQTGDHAQAMVTPSQVLNSVAAADFAALTSDQLLLLTLLMQGGSVDVSKGSTIRTLLQSIFAGSKGGIDALVAVADQPMTTPWWQANGFQTPIGTADLKLAGIAFS